MIGVWMSAALLCFGAGEPLDGHRFRITFQTAEYGPLEAIVAFDGQSHEIVGSSSNAATPIIRSMIADEAARGWDGEVVLTLRLRREGEGRYSGRVIIPFGASDVTLRLDHGSLNGRIDAGVLAGPFTGNVVSSADEGPLRDYPAVLAAIDRVLPEAIFDPRVLEADAYRIYRHGLGDVAAVGRDDVEFVLASDVGWGDATFSHFALSRRSRSQTVADVDAAEAPPVELRFDNGIAILRVNTLLGEEAARGIETSLEAVRAHAASALVLDLRGTPGGSLAAKTLIEGLISTPMELGWFTANTWWRSHDTAPTARDIISQPSSDLADPSSAFEALMRVGVLRVQLRPAEEVYAGPVFVLIDRRTASVAELVAAALGGSGRAMLIGERTAGQLLTADTLPLPEGFSLLTPLADYVDARLGRIEGVGVAPDVRSTSARALSRALRLAGRIAQHR